jgi:hypothetical protein
MRRILFCSGALGALALMAAETGSGSGGSPDPIAKADPAPAPKTADQVAPAEPKPDPATGAVGNAKDADPSPPTNKGGAKAAAKAAGKGDSKTAVMVWVQPGDANFGIGKVLRFPVDHAEILRGAGRARYASEAEIEAAGDDIPDVEA